MNKFSFASLTLLAAFASASADVFEVQPGSLIDNLDAVRAASEVRLVGKADIRDLQLLRDLQPAPDAVLDMSALSVAELNSDNPEYLGKSYFKANIFPSYILFKSNFSKVILPSDIRIIEAGALASSGIREISIPEGVTSIGDYTFYGCPDLEKVTLPSSLVTIGKGAFANCPRLSSVNINATSVNAIPRACFSGCSSLKSLNLSDIQSVGSEAFSGTALTSVVMPQVSWLAPYALAGMSQLREVVLNSEATFNKGTLMNNTGLIELSGIPAHIPDLFAANCTAYYPEAAVASASSIGKFAFANSQISDLVLGSHLSSIDLGAFMNAALINHIDATALGDMIPDVEDGSFSGFIPSEVRLKVADNTEDAWRGHPVWGNFNIYSDLTSGIDRISDSDDDSAIRVSLSGSAIHISAPEPITVANIYDMSGALLLSMPTGGIVSDADTSSLPAGVLILSVKAGNESKGVKIIL